MASSRLQRERFTGGLSRRDWLRLAAAGGVGLAQSRWLPSVAAEVAPTIRGKRSVILLWMPGGPSQIDTFDPKPGHANGGPFKAISTSVPGITISEHLPELARQMAHLALVRSMTTKEGDHGRASHLLRTGYSPEGPVRYPTLGSALSKELASPENELPDYVSTGSNNFVLNRAAFQSGFLGPRYAPLNVSAVNAPTGVTFEVPNLKSPISPTQNDQRLAYLNEVEAAFRSERPDPTVDSRRAAYERAVRLMRSKAGEAFRLDDEPAALRDRYGRQPFGQGCLLARRLVEHGVPFIEVGLTNAGNGFAGWDTHQNNFEGVKQLSAVLDSGWATLIADLRDRGLLESTLIVWMGEFGRTPIINAQAGRDHFPVAWSTVLGGAIRGGQVVGKTDAGGTAVEERPVSHADLLATIYRAVGVDPSRQNLSNVGRPIRLADPEGKPITEVLV